MFYDTAAIASTAVSSFNNAALYFPFFFAVGLLTLPLFFMVYTYGRDFVSRFGWNNQNVESQTLFWTGCFSSLWLVLFGGNYAVIRDGISLLPMLNAWILFLLTIVVVNQSVKLNYLAKIQNIKHKNLFFILFLILIGLSGKPNWWGFLLQISAVLCGIIIGCRLHKKMSLVTSIVPILLMLLMVILMQPEFFRFGQLGNLTIIHLLCVLITGFFGITALVTRYAKPKEKIHASAYVKLKWLVRIFSMLAFLLFILTESVPVFIGLLICIAISEYLTIYHSKKINNDMTKQCVMLFVSCFGLLIVCPVLTALGVIYMLFNKNNVRIKNYTALL